MKTSVPALHSSYKKDAAKNYMDCYLALQLYQLTKEEREKKQPRVPVKDQRRTTEAPSPQSFSIIKYLKQHLILEILPFRKSLQKVHASVD